MSKKRTDTAMSRQRRERIRRAKHAQRAGMPPPGSGPVLPPGSAFAAERAMRQIHSLLGEQPFESAEALNARLAELMNGGRIPEMASAWKQDDPKWRAQELAYEALECGDRMEALRLAHEAQRLDPDCIEAQRVMVALLPVELENRIQLMREVAEKAERNFGEEFFQEHTGHFWANLTARPYMRVLQELGDMWSAADQLEEAIAVYRRMLELNPQDNQGIRYALLGLHLATRNAEAAHDLLSRFPGEEGFSGMFAWGRVVERWLSGQLAEAEAALERARQVNPFLEPFLSGARDLPRETSSYYRPGEESEAEVAAGELAVVWKRLPGFRDWLRARR